ncbi:hypothetical protein [[Leptolyngbya] sp. PCC 7376]|uniref:hypothetical protein n=1 Tax=[Leptolyngbya] sp. PCC 7376 TaxID=111781 RepID=UPI0002FFAD46|nr:hypothetical protein [[Leptolyngbya] sp. PCC 7376]
MFIASILFCLNPLLACYILQCQEDIWLFQTYSGLEAIAELPALDIDAPLTEIYESITFPAKTEDVITDDHSDAAPH